MQDLLAESQTPSERRFNSPYEGPVLPFWSRSKILSNIIQRPWSSASLRHRSLSWNVHRPRHERGGSGTGDLLIVDTEDLKTMPPSEIRVKRFKSRELDIPKRNNEFLSMQDGSTLARRTAVIHCCLQSGERPQVTISRKICRKKMDKREIYLQMLKFDKISGELWEVICTGIMLFQ